MIYKIGTVGEFMAWTQQVIRDPVLAKGAPKNWFDSEETALQASTGSVSAEALVKLLSLYQSYRRVVAKSIISQAPSY